MQQRGGDIVMQTSSGVAVMTWRRSTVIKEEEEKRATKGYGKYQYSMVCLSDSTVPISLLTGKFGVVSLLISKTEIDEIAWTA